MKSEHHSGIRTNLPFILSLLAATGIVVVSLLPRFVGWPSWVLRVVAIVLAAIGPIATQMEKRRAEDAQRLRIQSTADPGTIAAFPNLEAVVSEWITEERAACLESLTGWETRQARFNETKSFTNDAANERGLIIRELLDLEERQRNGEVRSVEEDRSLRQAQEQVAAAIAPLLKSLVPFGATERRSPEQYRDEVDRYLRESSEASMVRAREEFIASGIARIVVQVANPTDRPYESVVVELTFPKDVELFRLKEDRRDRARLPQRPDPFGTPHASEFGHAVLTHLGLNVNPYANLAPVEPSLTVDGSRVKFRQVRVRAKGSTDLHELFVVSRRAEGEEIEITWEATDGAALGRARGTFQLVLSEAPQATALLGAFLSRADENDH
jgi:hypothetical protein